MYRCEGCNGVVGPGIKCHTLPTEKYPGGAIAKEGKFCPACAPQVVPQTVPNPVYHRYEFNPRALDHLRGRTASTPTRPPAQTRVRLYW